MNKAKEVRKAREKAGRAKVRSLGVQSDTAQGHLAEHALLLWLGEPEPDWPEMPLRFLRAAGRIKKQRRKDSR